MRPLSVIASALVLSMFGVPALVDAKNLARAADAQARSERQSAEALLLMCDLRARTQRVARLYLESGSLAKVERTGYSLARERAALDSLYARLSLAPAVAADRSTSRALGLWQELKAVIDTPYSRSQGDLAYALSEELYNHTQKAAQSLESQITSDSAFAMDVSTRAMAQSERIAKALIQSSLTRSRSAASDLESWTRELAAGMAQLEGVRVNDNYIRDNVALGRVLSLSYTSYVNAAMRSFKPTALGDVASASDALWSILAATRDRYEFSFRMSHGLPSRVS